MRMRTRRLSKISRNLGVGFGDWAARSLTGVGEILQFQGDAETALQKYQEAQSLDMELAIVKQHLGLAYLDLGKPEQALQFFGGPGAGQAIIVRSV